ncbi:hypothetical protein Cni_G17811 [Canna indica]|uniref:Uncharacterized protein n=1 Tax=Canna indica TaxID=4628 RepID=A0AAQ3QH45_9LILI|nr:hypothetical protein Cni_G17811 [Canna indica]
MENGGRQPMADEVIGRLKDDGDFDSLRLKIIRKVKENEELRSSIVSEVKQSVVLNEDGSEKMKLRQLSDAIYQELGSKIMGQISDEVWKVIRSYENDIRGTVESVYDRIVKPEANKIDGSSPSKEPPTDGKEDRVSSATPSTGEKKASDGNTQTEAAPGFIATDQQSSKVEATTMLHDEQPQSSNGGHNNQEQVDVVPPGFGPLANSAASRGGVSDEDPDVPPGFG